MLLALYKLSSSDFSVALQHFMSTKHSVGTTDRIHTYIFTHTHTHTLYRHNYTMFVYVGTTNYREWKAGGKSKM